MKREVRITHMGLDSHRRFSKVTARDAQGRIVWRQRLNHEDRQALREVLSQWPAGVPVILEGTFGWGWLSDELKWAGQDPHLASSGKVAKWREARGVSKSDRLDGDLLSELWDQKERWWEVWLAPPEVRDQREWLRYRMGLVGVQTQSKNRIHATLHRHGIVHGHSDLFGVSGRRFLSGLIVEEGGLLSESGRKTLRGQLMLLEQVRGLIAGATKQFRRQVAASAAAMRLKTLPGISWVLAYTILAEIGRIERFRSAAHLASYSLLAPRSHDSGLEDRSETPMGRHVGHAGRRTLKWAWIEAAHGAVRRGGRFREIFDRRTNGGRRDRNRGYIVVAHEMCRIGYVLWKKDVDYSETPPPRPGTKQSELLVRERTQPDHPMARVVNG